MRLAFGILLISALSITGCSQLGAASGSADSRTQSPGGAGGVLSRLRPKADPAVIAQMRQEDANKQQEAQAEAERLAQATQDGIGRILPKVSTDPISASGLASSDALGTQEQPQIVAPSAAAGWGTPAVASTPMDMAAASPIIPQIAAATYGPNYGAPSAAVPPPPPGALSGGGLVPPPPAVTLSTQANVGFGQPQGYAPQPYPYPYPYAPYPYPMQQQQQQPGQEAAPAQPQRPALFGNKTTSGGSSDDDDRKVERPKKDFVPIAPVGMEPRSPYKQRDDLRILWKGVVASAGMRQIVGKDEKLADVLNRTDVGLPSESTKGSFSVSQRQVDAVFKAAPLDKRVQASIKQKQADLVQAYYRYLHAYNRFALEQQTVAARKQEIEVANSDSEKQRAAADLARAQNDAEATKEDMRTAQYELAAAAGANAARSVIAKVANIAPSIESLAQAEASQAPQETKDSGVLASARSFFFGGHGKDKAETPAPPKEEKKQPKEKVAKKDKSTNKKSGEKGGDLAPAPSVASAAEPANDASSGGEAPATGSAISFELKGVNITARKSILSVSIKNNGADSFSFSPDVISVAENNKKLSDAALRADFDQTLVKPNEEVKGTITIFGRPWNDKLAVFISDGGKNIPLRR